MVITALAADYKRRAEEIAKKELHPRIIMEYKYYNTKIFGAVAEVVGPSEAERYIEAIGEKRGYPKNGDIFYSENLYYKRKQECKNNIARKLNLAE